MQRRWRTPANGRAPARANSAWHSSLQHFWFNLFIQNRSRRGGYASHSCGEEHSCCLPGRRTPARTRQILFDSAARRPSLPHSRRYAMTVVRRMRALDEPWQSARLLPYFDAAVAAARHRRHFKTCSTCSRITLLPIPPYLSSLWTPQPSRRAHMEQAWALHTFCWWLHVCCLVGEVGWESRRYASINDISCGTTIARCGDAERGDDIGTVLLTHAASVVVDSVSMSGVIVTVFLLYQYW